MQTMGKFLEKILDAFLFTHSEGAALRPREPWEGAHGPPVCST
jgi:hypothetical protein